MIVSFPRRWYAEQHLAAVRKPLLAEPPALHRSPVHSEKTRGGWLNRDIAGWYADYATTVARRLGDRVKMWATLNELAVFVVFLTLEITEILLAIGFFRVAHGQSDWVLHAGGWMGIVTAAAAWFTSAAGVVNGMSPKPVLPVGRPLWGAPAAPRP